MYHLLHKNYFLPHNACRQKFRSLRAKYFNTMYPFYLDFDLNSLCIPDHGCSPWLPAAELSSSHHIQPAGRQQGWQASLGPPAFPFFLCIISPPSPLSNSAKGSEGSHTNCISCGVLVLLHITINKKPNATSPTGIVHRNTICYFL